MTKRYWMATGLLLLAACGSKGEDSGDNNSTQATSAVAPVDENLMQDPQNHAVPLDPPANQPKGRP